MAAPNKKSDSSQFYVGIQASASFMTGPTFFNTQSTTTKGTPISNWSQAFYPGYTLSAQVGYQVNRKWAFEFAYQHNDLNGKYTIDTDPLDTGNHNNSGRSGLAGYLLMINTLYNISINKKIQPYIGAGIGYSKANLRLYDSLYPINNGDGFDNGRVAFQALAGIQFPLNNKLILSLGYRLTYLYYLADVPPSYAKPFLHQVNIGINYVFDF